MKEGFPPSEENEHMLDLSPSFSSPTSAVSLEETKILSEYISQQNLFNITQQDEKRKKPLILKKFFKMKRNQQVVVSSFVDHDAVITTEGKVTAIGRDFVMLTNLKERIWIPYSSIDSATIPFGYPTYSNPHQHHIYDNQLQQKLLLRFGETVSKKDTLIQQFFEESLRTNLHSWKGIWIEVKTADHSFFGKIAQTTNKEVFLQFFNTDHLIPLNDIRYVSTIRFVSLWKKIMKMMLLKN
ncbi:hypothetical protein [Bacillus sp. Hm123]|uniref:hypothetical protein n=1 Tax=Bacillus sp. Hm123 TaxID=3450745 RepID=UPI003F42F782